MSSGRQSSVVIKDIMEQITYINLLLAKGLLCEAEAKELKHQIHNSLIKEVKTE